MLNIQRAGEPDDNCVEKLRGWAVPKGIVAVLLALMGGLANFASTANASENSFATVWKVSGEVIATQPSNSQTQTRTLREGDEVFVGERVKSGSAAEALLKTEDAGLVAIRPNAEFVVERYAASGVSTDLSTLRLLTGSLRLVTGWIGKINRQGYRVVTPTSTIGIRGTDHEPFVVDGELAKRHTSPEGTYDKVNRGGTVLTVGENRLDIDAGKVGFARAAAKTKDRALMTLLLPVLLDKIPSFYVPGKFDAEVEMFSQKASETSMQLLKKRQSRSGLSGASSCDGASIAQTWLEGLDSAIGRGDAAAVVAMFAPGVVVEASVLSGDGSMSALTIGRDDFVKSTIAATKDLKNYSQRRISIETRLMLEKGVCDALLVKSAVIEQGIQIGTPFRFESLEEFDLENMDGSWIAVKARTRQSK
jgi:hypothetical protein